jgi:hypothetical protein
LPAARVTDRAICASVPDVIVKGSPTVMIGNLPAARIGDQTAHGGVIIVGCFTVIIGETGSGSPANVAPMSGAFRNAASSGTALVCKGPCPACGHA